MLSKTPLFDAAVKPILTALSPGQEMSCPLSGKTWPLSEEEIAWCHFFHVPPSKVEPETRLNYLGGFNTGFAFFWKTDDLTGKPILAAIHPDSPFKVISDAAWHAADHRLFGQEPDFFRSVFDQIWELETAVPFEASRNVNVDDASVAIACVNTSESYMACASLVKRSFYTYTMVIGEDDMDVANGERVSRSFFVGGSRDIADSAYIFDSNACFHSTFLFDCWNCESCFGATNKRNKKYLWFNEPLSQGEWEHRRKKVDLSDAGVLSACLSRFYELWRKEGIWPEAFSTGNEDGEGERLVQCVRCHESYWQMRSKDCFRVRLGLENDHVAYGSGNAWLSNSYMSTGGASGSDCKFCVASAKTRSSEYCINCLDCEYCFGCVSLKSKRYCVLNKQYNEETYWPLVDRLKTKMLQEEMYGEFFPAKFSISGFPFSMGELYFGYSDEDLRRFGVPVFDPTRGQVLAPTAKHEPLDPSVIPERLEEAQSFVGVPLRDAELGRNFSVTPAEYALRKQERWPFPRQHFISRLTNLIRHSNSPLREETKCASCGSSVLTYKNFVFPERRVFCRACYLSSLEKNG
ncbi:MAG TPA: hypothetical protein VJB99_02835 [Patescibacteria group bacterium]|nr:hypothetical protein [Patescibacteria group bacterium]